MPDQDCQHTCRSINCIGGICWVLLREQFAIISRPNEQVKDRLNRFSCFRHPLLPRPGYVPQSIQVPKDIPWFKRNAAQMFMSGFLPFSAIYIELHFIFASVWGHQIYTMFGILILAFALLLIVCSFITV